MVKTLLLQHDIMCVKQGMKGDVRKSLKWCGQLAIGLWEQRLMWIEKRYFISQQEAVNVNIYTARHGDIVSLLSNRKYNT